MEGQNYITSYQKVSPMFRLLAWLLSVICRIASTGDMRTQIPSESTQSILGRSQEGRLGLLSARCT